MNEKILIPLSILVAGSFIGLALYFTSNNNPVVIEKYDDSQEQEIEVRKVDPIKDHISGSKNAEIFIIEYSDMECSFCKNYNKQVVQKVEKLYEDNEKVGMVFRHFPLTSEHPSSFEEAVSLECASELGGDEKFFKFKEKIFSETASDGNFSSSRLEEIAVELEIKKDDFITCIKNPKSIQKVTDSFEEALSLGLNTTPSVFLQLSSGESYPIKTDWESTKNLIDAYLLENQY